MTQRIIITMDEALTVLKEAGIKSRLRDDYLQFGENDKGTGYLTGIEIPQLRSIIATATTDKAAREELISFAKEAIIDARKEEAV